MSKIMIEKNTVQETLLIPLYGRKMAMELYPDLFADKDCQKLLESIEFEVPPMKGIKAQIPFVRQALRLTCKHYIQVLR